MWRLIICFCNECDIPLQSHISDVENLQRELTELVETTPQSVTEKQRKPAQVALVSSDVSCIGNIKTLFLFLTVLVGSSALSGRFSPRTECAIRPSDFNQHFSQQPYSEKLFLSSTDRSSTGKINQHSPSNH